LTTYKANIKGDLDIARASLHGAGFQVVGTTAYAMGPSPAEPQIESLHLTLDASSAEAAECKLAELLPPEGFRAEVEPLT
jgi:hypothetical protein